MDFVFDPASNILRNIRRYSSSEIKQNTTVLPCIITKVHTNKRADIYIPYSSSVLLSLPIIFNGFSEEQGDITMPEENSMALYIASSDGRRFVFGGISLSDTYIVRNILPGETERYVANASFKQDLIGNQIFSSGTRNTVVYGADGKTQKYSTAEYEDNGVCEVFAGGIEVNDGTRLYNIRKCYRKENRSKLNAVKESENLRNKICEYLVGIQNLKEEYCKEDSDTLKEKISNDYQVHRVCQTMTEEGCAFIVTPRNELDKENLTESNLAKGADGSYYIFRFRIFDDKGELISSYAVTEKKNVETWEKTLDFDIDHILSDYPTIAITHEDFNSPSSASVDFNVMYLSKSKFKVSVNRKYGFVRNIAQQSDYCYLVRMESGAILRVSLCYSPRRMMEELEVTKFGIIHKMKKWLKKKIYDIMKGRKRNIS